MANKATDKARGRPKTKEYVTMLARVPAELADLVKRYAVQHGQIPLSLLIREGLEWRVGDGDPRGNGMYLSQPMGISEQVYNSNTGIKQESQQESQAAEALQEVRALLRQQWEQIQALAQALERQKVLAGDGVYSSNTGIVLRKQGHVSEHASANDTAEVKPMLPGAVARVEVETTQNGNTVIQPVEAPEGGSKTLAFASHNPPTFDPAKHHLGKLCKRGHAWGTTGQSLKNADNQCLECRALAKREKDARKKAEREAQLATT